jgi:cysteine desulfurase / selenocysteine lyase
MKLRSQFLFFKNNSNIYLDSAASTQKPQSVIDAITDFYSSTYSNNHGVHDLANNLNDRIEETRELIAQFINAKSSKEIIFTSGATESFNLIASTIKVPKNKKNILLCIAEHHSNLLPWQVLAQKNDLEIRYFGLTENEEIDMQNFENKIDSNTFLVAVSHCSNVLGIINNVQPICKISSDYGAISVVDATQSIVHREIDVREIDCDFLAFSGHKIYGPTGIGILYGKHEHLEKLGNYKELVTKEKNYWKETPYRLEAGTINLAGIIGLNAAIEWFIENKKEIFEIEKELYDYTLQRLSEIESLNLIENKSIINNDKKTVVFDHTVIPDLIGNPLTIEIKKPANLNPNVILNSFQNPQPNETKLQNTTDIPIFTFTVQGINSYDLAQYLNLKNISVRVGQHCTGLLHEYLELDSTLRISLACYNTKEDIDKAVEEIKNGIERLG